MNSSLAASRASRISSSLISGTWLKSGATQRCTAVTLPVLAGHRRDIALAVRGPAAFALVLQGRVPQRALVQDRLGELQRRLDDLHWRVGAPGVERPDRVLGAFSRDVAVCFQVAPDRITQAALLPVLLGQVAAVVEQVRRRRPAGRCSGPGSGAGAMPRISIRWPEGSQGSRRRPPTGRCAGCRPSPPPSPGFHFPRPGLVRLLDVAVGLRVIVGHGRGRSTRPARATRQRRVSCHSRRAGIFWALPFSSMTPTQGMCANSQGSPFWSVILLSISTWSSLTGPAAGLPPTGGATWPGGSSCPMAGSDATGSSVMVTLAVRDASGTTGSSISGGPRRPVPSQAPQSSIAFGMCRGPRPDRKYE